MSSLRYLALSSSFFLLAGLAAAQPPQKPAGTAAEVRLAPSALTELARHLSDADPYQRLEFAQITLDGLIDAYHQELDTAMVERPSTQARRLKLARWKQATRAMLSELDGARVRLSESADVAIMVDSARQVILFIDNEPVIVTASRPELEKRIAQSVVEQFCAFNDCSFLDAARTRPAQRADFVSGTWNLSGLGRPVYETGRNLHCAFSDLTERGRKAMLCTRLLDQLIELRGALVQARLGGYRIDWRFMAVSRPESRDETVLRINDSGAFLRLALPLLPRLALKDWEAAVGWLRKTTEGGPATLMVSQADQLLP